MAAWVFDSRYQGSDGVWRDTRYNRNFAVNCLLGKEWQLGENQQKIIGLNVRVSYQGGERYSPVNQEFSLSKQETFLDETRAFFRQFSPALTSHVTASYRVNKAKVVHEIMLKVINATMYAEFSGFQYHHQSRRIDERLFLFKI